jgi:hypothetical protein
VKEQYGFLLDVERGYWESAKDADADLDPEDPMSKRRQRVIPYVEDTRNTLLIEPSTPLDAEQMASLEAALKAAFQVVFQLEEDELATEPLPSLRRPQGAAVLRIGRRRRRRAAAPRRRTRTLAPDRQGSAAPLPRRPRHARAAHRSVRGGLLRLSAVVPQPDRPPAARPPAGHPDLRGSPQREPACDRERQRRRADGSRRLTTRSRVRLVPARARPADLPDRAQVYFEAAGAKPDFVYDDACAVVFIDGPHHDPADRQERDRQIDAAFRDLGYKPLRFGHRDDWAQLVDTYRSVFGEGSE